MKTRITGEENRIAQAKRWKDGRRNFRVWQAQQELVKQATVAAAGMKRDRMYVAPARKGWGVMAAVATIKSFFSRRAA